MPDPETENHTPFESFIGRDAPAGAESPGHPLTQAGESKSVTFVMTACRCERTADENKALNRSLAQDIRSFGWGYFPVFLGLTERIMSADGAKEKVHVREESFLVTATGDHGEVVPKICSLLKKYGQEGALMKSPNEDAVLLYRDGSASAVS